MGDPDDELARLAQQGQARLAAAQHEEAFAADAASERHLRTAIGGIHGTPLKRALLVLGVLCGVATVIVFVMAQSAGAFVMMHWMPVWMTGLFASIAFVLLGLFLPPLASRGAVEAERRWAAALPFPLESYFKAIAAPPAFEYHLDVEIETSRELAPGVVQGVIANYDPASQVLEVRGTRVHFRTGPISGSTGVMVNRRPVNRNHRLGKAVHRLVDVVLLPIHRSNPVSRVTLSRPYSY